MEPEFHPLAIAEARDARLWYRKRSVLASQRFVQELDTAIDAIIESPLRFQEYLHKTRRYVFIRYPFFVVYALKEQRLFIVAVAHAKRKPGYWRDRVE